MPLFFVLKSRLQAHKMDAEGDTMPTGPIVFQCLQCYRIVGDSLAMVDADADLRTITLQGEAGQSILFIRGVII